MSDYQGVPLTKEQSSANDFLLLVQKLKHIRKLQDDELREVGSYLTGNFNSEIPGLASTIRDKHKDIQTNGRNALAFMDGTVQHIGRIEEALRRAKCFDHRRQDTVMVHAVPPDIQFSRADGNGSNSDQSPPQTAAA